VGVPWSVLCSGDGFPLLIGRCKALLESICRRFPFDFKPVLDSSECTGIVTPPEDRSKDEAHLSPISPVSPALPQHQLPTNCPLTAPGQH
jgi:hypothetical protein